MRIIDPATTPTADLHQYLLGVVSPRPIAFVSTVDENGNPNLAPYSFFNCFSSNPPIIVFSSNRRVSDNTTKDTLHNIEVSAEVVINAVNYNIVRQMTVASISYPPGTSEFEKAGLSPIPSDLVKPFRVKESPAQMECRVEQIIPLGQEGGAGNLIVCRVLRMHISEDILDEKGRINPHKIDLMGRMGRAFYVRSSGEAIHRIFQPVNEIGIGFEELPESAKNSDILTGNNLGVLASLMEVPSIDSIANIEKEKRVQQALIDKQPMKALHLLAQKELNKENRDIAAQIVWLADQLAL